MTDAMQRALRLQREGDLAGAAQAYREILAVRPGDPAASHQLGLLLLQSGRAAEAIPLLETVVRVAPDRPGLHLPLGIACFHSGRDEQASAALARELELSPNHPHALFWAGMVLARKGDTGAAVVHFQRAIAAQPDLVEAHANLGRTYMASGDAAGAVQAFERALRLRPNAPEILGLLGAALCQQGNLLAGIRHLERAASLAPEMAPIRLELGRALTRAGCHEDAIPHLKAAVAAQPNHPQWQEILGGTLQDAQQYAEAEAVFSRLLETHPEHAARYRLELARACLNGNRHDRTLAVLEDVLAEDPDNPTALVLLAETHQRLAHAEQATELLLRVEQRAPDHPEIGERLSWVRVYRTDLNPLDVRAEVEAIVRRHVRRQVSSPAPEPYRNSPVPERRLTIGYISPDLRTHVVAFFLENILACHDHTRFAVHCYAHIAHREDQVTARLRSLADHWVDITRLSAAEAAAAIRSERVDILIDLAGNSPGNRLDVMAMAPAPVQITYLGSPMTTGLDTIGYRLTDAQADPPGFDAHCSEQLIRLPGSFLCYRPPSYAPDPGPPPSVRNGRVTFGSFNNFPKLNPDLVATWAEVLKAVPDSRMLIKARALATRAGRDTLLEWFARSGVGEERLQVVGMVPDLADHLSMYHRVDIALDSFPYNGTTTTCEALWMGVPVVALAGDRHMGRVGVSLLTTTGLEELIAPTRADYVDIAARLAADPERLAALHRELRRRVADSPLCDGKTFTGNFEATLRNLWRAWCDRQRSGTG